MAWLGTSSRRQNVGNGCRWLRWGKHANGLATHYIGVTDTEFDDRPVITLAFGPVFRGILANRAGWPWIFWFLPILSATCITFIVLFLPETCYNVIGSGHQPNRRLQRAVISFDSPSQRKGVESGGQSAKKSELGQKKSTFRLPNPFTSVNILLITNDYLRHLLP